MHVFDTERLAWYKPHVSGTVPRPRNHHTAAALNVDGRQQLYFFAGWNGRGYMEDLDCLDLRTLPTHTHTHTTHITQRGAHLFAFSDSLTIDLHTESEESEELLSACNQPDFHDITFWVAVCGLSMAGVLTSRLKGAHLFSFSFSSSSVFDLASQGKPIYAHKVILASRSSYLRSMLTTGEGTLAH
jgi:hypothetical protein